ncbi:MAG: N-6 DNA methylase [Candidatus Hydrothermae bacterium]|nr:N-6 DNA methylase [Candidatus Hydrothermae bacterium]
MSRGDAREESFYPALAELIRDVAKAMGLEDIDVTIQPRPTEGGNSDLRVWDGKNRIVGYVEAKAPYENLEKFESTSQLRRYRETFPNLILTNFLEFRLYRDGRPVAQAILGRPFALTELQQAPPLEHPEEAWSFLEQFLSFSVSRPITAEKLAIELARRTRFLRDIVLQELERGHGDGHLEGFYEAFQRYLIGSLSREEFADLYAQTITYGLFAARTRASGDFTRKAAFDLIPPTIGVLRDLFRYISMEELPEEMAWIVDDIAGVLAVADVQQMMAHFNAQGREDDPVVHFYETFLAHYDPEERERRGVYYTPAPVVSYIVRSLHRILQEEFGLSEGLASREVTLLDPAAGTMTFVVHAARKAIQAFEENYGSGGRGEFIREHVLKNFYAFELMVAPYAVGHLKMGFFLQDLGYTLGDGERVPFFLTNTLDMTELEASKLPGLSSLAEESRLAGRVKREQPILVILGNPPYSVSSSNKSDFIEREMEVYKKAVRNERNLMPLSDDYVKFIRFAQWKIEQAGRGVIGFITNHSYLDNPTFRGMRRSLVDTFDEIYILDLHGNSLKRERCPDGSLDQNVFDIRQGVAIVFFIKTGEKGDGESRVYHADLWGRREEKYQWLAAHDVNTTKWTEIQPKPEFYLFVPRDETALEHYNKFIKIVDIFPTNSTGIKTHRDHFVFDFDREVLERRIRIFLDLRLPDDLVKETFHLKDNRDWNLQKKRKLIQQDRDWKKKIVPCLYRPFDVRWLFYHRHAIDFRREQVMRHMLAGNNMALVFVRQVKASTSWQHCFVSNYVVECCLVSNYTSEIGYVAPVYLYPETMDNERKKKLFSESMSQKRKPNLKSKFLAALSQAYDRQIVPEQVFHYIYAVLYTPSYREKYADFLRLDFPRIPFTRNPYVFERMAALGERLVALHLLKSPELDPPLARFEGDGDNRVGRNKREGFLYDESSQRVYINKTQYFAPVPPDVWRYPIGGYHPAEKWLKDRKGRQLSLEEIKAYCRIVTALAKTIELQKEIDEIYPEVEKEVIDFSLKE